MPFTTVSTIAGRSREMRMRPPQSGMFRQTSFTGQWNRRACPQNTQPSRSMDPSRFVQLILVFLCWDFLISNSVF